LGVLIFAAIGRIFAHKNALAEIADFFYNF